jgi:hypothetical protein
MSVNAQLPAGGEGQGAVLLARLNDRGDKPRSTHAQRELRERHGKLESGERLGHRARISGRPLCPAISLRCNHRKTM